MDGQWTGAKHYYYETATHFGWEATSDAVVRSVMRAWNLPCLGLAIIDMSYVMFAFHTPLTIVLGHSHCVAFYAVIYLGQWRVVALTPGLSCIWASRLR